MIAWDPWVRGFHWLLVSIVVANQFLLDGGGAWHEWLGYAACGLVAWRVYWAAVGRSPQSYRRPPLALLVRAVLLLCVLLLGLTGWMTTWDLFFGEEWLETTHEWIANVLLAAAALHVAGIVRESLRTGENLLIPMLPFRRR